MANAVLMPKAGISVETCILTEWLKKPGDTVAEGDILFTYETDKASFECESTCSGTLLETFYEAGDEVDVLVNVCAVGEPGEDVSALRPASESPAPGEPVAEPEKDTQKAPAAAPAESTSPLPVIESGGTLRISPRARNLAAGKGVDPSLAHGTGPYGRVIERDIREVLEHGPTTTAAALAAAGTIPQGLEGSGIGGKITVGDLSKQAVPSPASATSIETEYEDVKFSGIRRAISQSMGQSLASIPQLTHHFTFDATELLAYRQSLKKAGEGLDLPNITIGDMILYAVSRMLTRYPDLNANMLEPNSIRRFRDVNLGVAVDTPRGLMVPVIKQANRKSLAQISAELKALASQAQTGAVSPDDMSGGTFTVSNLGNFGVESFTPVINPPQTGILGVNTIVKRPREGKNGNIELYPAMGLSLTYDHRAIDGAPSSRFMQELCRALENFSLLLAK